LAPDHAALARLLIGEVAIPVDALRTSPRQISGRGTSLLAVLECAALGAWGDAHGSQWRQTVGRRGNDANLGLTILDVLQRRDEPVAALAHQRRRNRLLDPHCLT
jgi:hypothetical protein